MTWPNRFLKQGGFVLLTTLLIKVLQEFDYKDEIMMNLLD